MSTSKVEAEAARTRAIAEALKASGARSLNELLADHERHKQQLDELCSKLEALPRVNQEKGAAVIRYQARDGFGRRPFV
jgi:hypothetical protein